MTWAVSSIAFFSFLFRALKGICNYSNKMLNIQHKLILIVLYN